MKIKYKKIKPGTEFKYNNLYFLKYNSTMSILNRKDNVKGYYCPFDNYNNNYKDSLIRYYINYRFLKSNNIKISDLQKLPNGDFAKILSKSEYEKIKDKIRPMFRWWLRTPYSGFAISAWFVDFDGYFFSDDVNIGCGVRPALKFNPKLEVEVVTDET